MPSAGLSLEQTKKQVQAFFASFDRDLVPSAYYPDIFAGIDDEQSRRPPSEWIIGDDIMRSMIQMACHKPSFYRELDEMEGAELRTRKLGQKINRLFNALFQEYDNLKETQQGIQRTKVLSEIADKMRALSRSAGEDIENPVYLQEIANGIDDLKQATLSMLQKVCLDFRTKDPFHTHNPVTLYHFLIHSPTDGHDFIVDALWRIKALVPNAFGDPDTQSKLRDLCGFLLAYGAPRAYHDKLLALL